MSNLADTRRLLDKTPNFDDTMCSLLFAPSVPRGVVEETREVIALARRFNEEVVRPYTLELDRKMHREPDYLAWDFVKKANDWGFYTMWIPRLFGGQGYNMASMSHFVEEIASECLAMANLIGVHYLGIGTLSASYNTRMIKKICMDVVEGREKGEPRLVSLAITEPGAGTDVEEVDLVDKADLGCMAKRVDGGYLVNGSKIFISNGHLSKWHMLIAYSDFKTPSENTVMMAVQTGTPGFTFGRIEKKMGQKACPASELVFQDCFVADEFLAVDSQQWGNANYSRTVRETGMQMIDYVVSTSRAGVGAFGAGVARGALNEAFRFASETEVAGKLLINHEWAQCMLAEMQKNFLAARMSYMETNYANSLYGTFQDFQSTPGFYVAKHMPKALIKNVVQPWLDKPAATKWMRDKSLEGQTKKEQHCTSGWGSLTKFMATDLAVKNCQLALSMMGAAGVRHDQRAEKHLRDSKLLQIYEGTNQLNRLNVFKCFLSADCADACVFDE